MDDYTSYYDYLIEKEIPILIYVGEFDQADGPVSHLWMKNLKKLNDDFWN